MMGDEVPADEALVVRGQGELSDVSAANGAEGGAAQVAIGLRSAIHAGRNLDLTEWADPDSPIGARILLRSREALDAYKANSLLVDEHANIELATAEGGYGRRQIYELVQNGADALIRQPGGGIQLVLTADALYCANEGEPIDLDGVNAILMSNLSVKRRTEIGRFGLGFKSVLGITHRPLFFSRSGSFRFDPALCSRLIRDVVPGSERVPVLRLSEPIDPRPYSEADPVLAELMAWATTVVKLPRDEGDSSWLHDDLLSFPAPFLLFSAHVGSLVLEDRESGLLREILVRSDLHGCHLSEGNETANWAVFRVDHAPSAGARLDAGELAHRSSVPVIWAVPRDGARGRGRFWAFFPTEYETTLSGIVNAPWKTNEDRQNLLRGQFNDELLDVAANLVVSNLPTLLDPTDPGRLFDILPARGREAPSWADATLTELVYKKAEFLPTVPDQTGRLVLPAALRIHPAGAPREALQEWARYPGRPANWVHWTVETRERRPRVEKLVGEPRFSSYAEWLEALVVDGTADASIAAIKVLGLCLAAEDLPRRTHDAAKRARIVLTSDDRFVAPDPHSLFSLEGSDDSERAGFVHPTVEADPQARKILVELGIGTVDPAAEYALYLDSIAWDFGDWEGFWVATAKVEPRRALELISMRGLTKRIRVKTLAGGWVSRLDCLLPGPIVPSDGSRDSTVAVDTGFHQSTVKLLEMLGVHAAPVPDGWLPEEERWVTMLDGYLAECYKTYDEATPELRQRPSREYLDLSHGDVLGPLESLRHLSQEGRLRFTSRLLGAQPDERDWKLRHRTVGAYPEVAVPDPVTWCLSKFGVLETSRCLRLVSDSVGPDMDRFRQFMPVAVCPDSWARRLKLPSTVDAIPAPLWQDGVGAALQSVDESAIAEFYAAACHFLEPPESIRCRVGQGFDCVLPTKVTVTSDRLQYEGFIDGLLPALKVETDEVADELVARWGLIRGNQAIETSLDAVPLVDPVPLVDEFTIVTDSTATDIRLRRQLLLMGVDLRVVTKPHPSGGMQRARLDVLHRCLQKNPNIYWTQQYSNPKNAEAYGRYAEHLFERLGRVDCLVGSVGTGGSMVGTVRRARQLSPQLHAIAVDTCHSVLFGQSDGRRLVRGMGNSIIPDMLDHTQFDSVSWMPAPATFEATRELLRTHGLFMGPTSGAAYQVARWWARSHPDQLVVVTMADAGHRYVDTVYSDKWVKRTLPWPTPIDPEPRQVITPKAGEECWSWMQWSRRRLSDLPVVTADQP